MADELMNMNEIVESLRLAAITSRNNSEQLGLLAKRQDVLQSEIDELKANMRNDKQDLENRMQNYEDRITVTRSMAQNIRNSIHSRVRDLLHIEYVDGVVTQECLYADKYYRPGFISRCYVDSRKESKLGTPYSETYQRDYEEVLNFINSWVPPRGTEGYKNYLDLRRKK